MKTPKNTLQIGDVTLTFRSPEEAESARKTLDVEIAHSTEFIKNNFVVAIRKEQKHGGPHYAS
jgi:hypothetical protein